MRITPCAALLLLAASAAAQLSGTYTLDPHGSGSRNYKSFNAAFTALVNSGVSGPTEFQVAAGFYNEHLSYAAVRGTSQTNTITFRSVKPRSATLTFNNNARIVLSSEWTAFDGLRFLAGGTSIEGVTFRGKHSTIRNCQFTNCALVVLNYHSRIHDNLFDNITHKPGILASGGDVDIHRNEFRLADARNGAIELSNSPARLLRSRIFNNLFWGKLRARMVDLRRGTDFAHNTVLVSGNLPIRFYSDAQSFIPRIQNNILVQLSDIPLIAGQARAISSGYFALHNNLYFAPNRRGYLFGFSPSGGNPLSFLNLASWQAATKQDKRSVYADPQLFDTKSSPPNLEPKGTSPAIGKADGTPSYVTHDYDGIKRKTPSTIGAYEGKPGPTFEPFGKGCPGTLANQPTIGYAGDLKLGSTTFAVSLSNALGGSGVNAYFAAGATRTTLPFGGGCDLLVTPHMVFLVAVNGSGPGNGSANVKIALPSDPKLRGAKAHFQWGVVDPAAKGIGVAFTQGATLTL